MRSHARPSDKRTGAEYWLCAPGLARAHELRRLPDRLGLSWSYYKEEPGAAGESPRLVVDLLDAGSAGEVDLQTWPEIEALLAGPGRFILKMSGFEFPLRVRVLPGAGVVIALEHLDESELARLHGAIVDEVVPGLLRAESPEGLLVACVTEEVYANGLPEALFTVSGQAEEVVCAPDFLLASSAIWARGAFVLGPSQTLVEVHGLTLVTTPGPRAGP